MGANLVADGATFRVWAPNASAVHVRGDFNNFEIRDDAVLVSEGICQWLGYIPGDIRLVYNGTNYITPEMAFGVGEDHLATYLSRANELLEAKGLSPFEEEHLRGEMNQLKALIDLCHAYGLAIILDLVFNHA